MYQEDQEDMNKHNIMRNHSSSGTSSSINNSCRYRPMSSQLIRARNNNPPSGPPQSRVHQSYNHRNHQQHIGIGGGSGSGSRPPLHRYPPHLNATRLRINQLEVAVASLTRENSQMKNAAVQYQRSLDVKEADIAALAKQFADLESKFIVLKDELNMKEEAMHKLLTENESLRNKWEHSIKRVNNLVSKVSVLMYEKDEAFEGWSDEEDRTKQQQIRIEELNALVTELESQASVVVEEKEVALDKLKEERNLVELQNDMINVLSTDNELLRDEVEDLQEKLEVTKEYALERLEESGDEASQQQAEGSNEVCMILYM